MTLEAEGKSRNIDITDGLNLSHVSRAMWKETENVEETKLFDWRGWDWKAILSFLFHREYLKKRN